jgi:hypothetical protein
MRPANVAEATLTARSIEPRSIYESRLTGKEVRARIGARSHPGRDPAPDEKPPQS